MQPASAFGNELLGLCKHLSSASDDEVGDNLKQPLRRNQTERNTGKNDTEVKSYCEL